MRNRVGRRSISDNRKRDTTSSGVGSVVISLGLIVLSGVLIMNSIKSISKAQQRSDVVELAQSQVEEMRLKNLDLMERKEEVCNDVYIEEEARNRLLYAKEGEILVVLPDTSEYMGVNHEDEDGEIDGDGAENEGWITWWKILRDGV